VSDYRKAQVGDLTLYATDLPPRSQLVRVSRDASFAYDRMIVVTERDGEKGRELFLQGWIGEPLSRDQWREAKGDLFAGAKVVVYERIEDDGTVREVRAPI
jgi:hypothetical protein